MPAIWDTESERLVTNADVFRDVNSGVYKAGFATTQPAYEEAFDVLFTTLDDLESRLTSQRFLVGGRQCPAEWWV